MRVDGREIARVQRRGTGSRIGNGRWRGGRRDARGRRRNRIGRRFRRRTRRQHNLPDFRGLGTLRRLRFERSGLVFDQRPFVGVEGQVMQQAVPVFAESHVNPALPMRCAEEAKTETFRSTANIGDGNRALRGRLDVTPCRMAMSDVARRDRRRPFIPVPPPPAEKLRLRGLRGKAGGEPERQSAKADQPGCRPSGAPGRGRPCCPFIRAIHDRPP